MTRGRDSQRTDLDDASLRVEGVSAGYGGSEVLRDVSLTVAPGEIVTVIGPNGAGKSTLLKVVSGLLRPRSGAIYFGRRVMTGKPSHAIVGAGVGHAPEGRRLFGRMTVAENIMMGAYSRRDKRKVREDFREICARFPILAERSGQAAGSLSGGEQQMAALARALMGAPRLLMLDEPSIGLAPQVVRRIGQVVSEVSRDFGIGVLLVEQNAAMAFKVASRAYVLELGQVKVEGPTEQLANDPRVRDAYLSQAGHSQEGVRR